MTSEQKLGILLLPGQLGSDNIPADYALTLKSGLTKKNTVLTVFQNGSFPLPFLEAQRFFFIIFCRNLVMLLEVNLIIFWRLPYDWVLLEFLTSTCP